MTQTAPDHDLTLLREYLGGGSVWGRMHALEAFGRIEGRLRQGAEMAKRLSEVIPYAP